MEKFNDNLQQFIQIIKNNYPDQKDTIDQHYNFDSPASTYIDEFLTNCTNNGDDISTKNEIIFSKGSTILNNINFYTIWNDDKLSDDQRENIWKYLHTLYIFAYEHKCENDFKTLLNNLKDKDTSKMDEETKTFKNIIESLTHKYKETDSDSNDENSTNRIPVPELFNGVIGNLAKEIAEEIDPSKINLDDPSKLLSSLMSGNLEEKNDESGIFNLVKDITGKIQNKISSGDLNEDQLLKEAQNMMKTFAGGNSGGFGNLPGMSENFNPMSMFNNMMKSGVMDNLDDESKTIVDDATNIINNRGHTGITSSQIENKAQLKSTRNRLRQRLEEKKKILAQKEKEKVEEIEEIEDDIDLDALADEIDGM